MPRSAASDQVVGGETYGDRRRHRGRRKQDAQVSWFLSARVPPRRLRPWPGGQFQHGVRHRRDGEPRDRECFPCEREPRGPGREKAPPRHHALEPRPSGNADQHPDTRSSKIGRYREAAPHPLVGQVFYSCPNERESDQNDGKRQQIRFAMNSEMETGDRRTSQNSTSSQGSIA